MSLDRGLRPTLRGDGGWTALRALLPTTTQVPLDGRWMQLLPTPTQSPKSRSPGRRVYRAQKAGRRSWITTRLAEERG